VGVVSITPQAVRDAASALRATASRLADTGTTPGAAQLDPRLSAALAELASATTELDRWVGTRLAWLAAQADGVAEGSRAADRFGGG
jgi:hypothetical protein